VGSLLRGCDSAPEGGAGAGPNGRSPERLFGHGSEQPFAVKPEIEHLRGERVFASRVALRYGANTCMALEARWLK